MKSWRTPQLWKGPMYNRPSQKLRNERRGLIRRQNDKPSQSLPPLRMPRNQGHRLPQFTGQRMSPLVPTDLHFAPSPPPAPTHFSQACQYITIAASEPQLKTVVTWRIANFENLDIPIQWCTYSSTGSSRGWGCKKFRCTPVISSLVSCWPTWELPIKHKRLTPSLRLEFLCSASVGLATTAETARAARAREWRFRNCMMISVV